MTSIISKFNTWLQSLPLSVKIAYFSLLILAIALLYVTLKQPHWLVLSTYIDTDISSQTIVQQNINTVEPSNNSPSPSRPKGLGSAGFDYEEFRAELMTQLSFEATKPSQCHYVRLYEDVNYTNRNDATERIAFSRDNRSKDFVEKWEDKRKPLYIITWNDDGTWRPLAHTYRHSFGSFPFQEARYFKIVDGNCVLVKAPLISSANELPSDATYDVRYHRDGDIMYVEFVSQDYDNDQFVFEMKLNGELMYSELLESSDYYINKVRFNQSASSKNQLVMIELTSDETTFPVSYDNAYFYSTDLNLATVKLVQMQEFKNSHVTSLLADDDDIYILIATHEKGNLSSGCYQKYGGTIECTTTLVKYDLAKNEFTVLNEEIPAPLFASSNPTKNEFAFTHGYSHIGGSVDGLYHWQNGAILFHRVEYYNFDMDTSEFEYKVGTEEQYKAYKQSLQQLSYSNISSRLNTECWRNGSFCEVD